MPKQDLSKEHSLDAKILLLRRECQQLRAEREYMQARVSDVCREIDALVQYYAGSKPIKTESDTSDSPSPDAARRGSVSLISLDSLREPPAERRFSQSSLSIDETALKVSGVPRGPEMGPPSCPPMIRSLQSSPNSRGYRRRVALLDEPERRSSYVKAETARDRSNSQQSLPETISRDTQARGLLVRAKSGDVRAAAKMSLSSSSPALGSRDFPVPPVPDRKEPVSGPAASKTCTDL